MEAIVNNLIKATGWSIFHSLWQGAIIYAVLLLTVMCLPKLKSKIKHNLAYGAMCLIFVCFCITFFSIFKLPVNDGPGTGTVVSISAEYYEYLSSLPQQISNRTELLFPYIVSVYGIGLIFQLFILSAGYKRMLLLKNAERTIVPTEWKKVFEEMVIKLNLKQNISFYLSEQVNVPLVIGYFKPVVLFPVALVLQLDIKQVEAILIHELSHIRRNDYLLNLIKTGIETLLFFNPFVWLSGRFINIEREHACDDLVLKFTGTPVTYAHALLKLEILKDKSSPALSMAATGKNQHLYQRIKRITNMRTNYMNAKQQIFAITLTVATVISLAWVKPAAAEKTKANTPLAKRIEIGGLGIKLKMQELPLVKPVRKAIQLYQDTTKKKRKYVIVTVDANGNRKEYNSIKEMPDSIRKEVVHDTFISGNAAFPLNLRLDTLAGISLAVMRSPELEENLAKARLNSEKIRLHLDAKDWKNQQRTVEIMARKGAEDTKKYFQSAEWKKQQKEIAKAASKVAEQTSKYFQSEDWRKQQKDIADAALKASEEASKYFSSPEWQKQQRVLVEQAQRSAEEVRKYYVSPEVKLRVQEGLKVSPKVFYSPDVYKLLQLTESKELLNSDEYKELKKKFDAEVEALKKKKESQTPAKTEN